MSLEHCFSDRLLNALMRPRGLVWRVPLCGILFLDAEMSPPMTDDERHILRGLVMSFATAVYNGDPLDEEAVASLLRNGHPT